MGEKPRFSAAIGFVSPGWGARRGCINPAFSPKRSESYYRAIEGVENSLPYLRLGKTFQCF
jgi:hypothetical protein